MTERERILSEKKADIRQISKKQKQLMIKAVRLINRPYKQPGTLYDRMTRVMSIAEDIKILEARKQIIVWQPVPKAGPAPTFAAGTCGQRIMGAAIVGENVTEVITMKDGRLISANVFGVQHESFLDIQNRLDKKVLDYFSGTPDIELNPYDDEPGE